jgi:hypothetical protein
VIALTRPIFSKYPDVGRQRWRQIGDDDDPADRSRIEIMLLLQEGRIESCVPWLNRLKHIISTTM